MTWKWIAGLKLIVVAVHPARAGVPDVLHHPTSKITTCDWSTRRDCGFAAAETSRQAETQTADRNARCGF
jgi:hypothetical protein